MDLDTRLSGETTDIPGTVNFVRTAGAQAVGDGGEGLYARVDSEPAHDAKFRSLDRYLPNGSTDGTNGGWWELKSRVVNPMMIDEDDDDEGWKALNTFIAAKQGEGVRIRGGALSALARLITIGVGAGDQIDRSTLGDGVNGHGVLIGENLLPLATKVRRGIYMGGSVGQHAPRPGEFNIFIGDVAGCFLDHRGPDPMHPGADDSYATRLIGIGSLAMHFARYAKHAVAIGRDALHNLRDGRSWTAVGYKANVGGEAPTGWSGEVTSITFLDNTEDDEGGTALGMAALQYALRPNTAVGYQAADSIKRGYGNSIFGQNAMRQVEGNLSHRGYIKNTNAGSQWDVTAFTWSGTTITVTVPGINIPMAGAYVKIRWAFSDTSVPREIMYFATRIDANTFTVSTAESDLIYDDPMNPTVGRGVVPTDRGLSDPHTRSGTSVGMVQWKEDIPQGLQPQTNYAVAVGEAVGYGLTQATRAILIGRRAGAEKMLGVAVADDFLVIGSASFSSDVKYRMPLIAGIQGSAGCVGVNVRPQIVGASGYTFGVWAPADDPAPNDNPSEKKQLLGVSTARTKVTNGFLSLAPAAELTIASGAITVTQTMHSVDTESDASNDDLDTINGGETGDILILTSAANNRTVLVKDGTGNLRLAADFALNHTQDTITLLKRENIWIQISASDNNV